MSSADAEAWNFLLTKKINSFFSHQKNPSTRGLSIQEISNERTHCSRTPKNPKYQIARSQLTERGPWVRSHSMFDGFDQKKGLHEKKQVQSLPSCNQLVVFSHVFFQDLFFFGFFRKFGIRGEFSPLVS